MRAKLLSSRASVSRTSRRDPRSPMLESLAAEFALLAQRRARMARQIDLLDRQIQAANTGLAAVQARMQSLTKEMAKAEPSILIRQAAAPLPPPPPPPPEPPPLSANARPASSAMKPALPRGLRPLPRPLPFRP